MTGTDQHGGTGRRRRHRLLALLVAGVVVAGSVTATDAASAPRADARPPMVPPSSFGPYKVGREVIQITSRTGRSRTVDVWYPVSPRTTGGLSLYVGPSFTHMAYVSRALDRVPVAKGRPFPLVVYSHGSGAMRFIATFFTETLASHGFVVISADHTGDTISDLFAGRPSTPDELPQVLASRAADERMILNGILTRSATRGDLLEGAVDPHRIGIAGHSYGGLTAFATVSGVRVDGPNAIPRDVRFKAIVTMDATSTYLSADDLARVKVPTLSIVGEDVPPGAASFWYQTRARPFAELRIDRAAHSAFSDVCRYRDLLPLFPDAPPVVTSYITSQAEAACDPPHLGPRQVQLLTDRYAIAFLLRHLAGDTRYAGYLKTRHGDGFDLTYPDPTVAPPPDTVPLPPVID
ncbi:MAG: hypothetical protein KF703_15550 [Actinobacteria bacterium]|nr:hypothetical protein [Actinomycetota bacterium]